MAGNCSYLWGIFSMGDWLGIVIFNRSVRLLKSDRSYWKDRFLLNQQDPKTWITPAKNSNFIISIEGYSEYNMSTDQHGLFLLEA